MSPATTLKRRVKMREIAHLAGVGPATVDRVLNNRKHVSVTTRQRVMQAKQALETGAQIVTSARPWRLKVFLPDHCISDTENNARHIVRLAKWVSETAIALFSGFTGNLVLQPSFDLCNVLIDDYC